MSLQEWKHNEINQKLMKKWGLLKEGEKPAWGKDPEAFTGTEEEEEEEIEAAKKGQGLEEASLTEDSRDKESEDYGKDESADKRKEDSLEHHLDSIEHHLHALRRDMRFDEEHIDEGHVHSADCEHADELSEGDNGEEKEKAPKPGVKVTKPEHLSATTTKLPPVKVKEGMSRKISVREAKELTSRIIERIKAESK